MKQRSSLCHSYHFSHSECVAEFHTYALHCHFMYLEITCHNDKSLQLKLYHASNAGLWCSQKGVGQELVSWLKCLLKIKKI